MAKSVNEQLTNKSPDIHGRHLINRGYERIDLQLPNLGVLFEYR